MSAGAAAERRKKYKRRRGIALVSAGVAAIIACAALLAIVFLGSAHEKERTVPSTLHVHLGAGRHTVYELVARYNGEHPPFSVQELGVEPLVPDDVTVTAPDSAPVAVTHDVSGRIEHGSNSSHKIFAAMVGFRAPVAGTYTISFRGVDGKVVIGRPAARNVVAVFIGFGLGALGLVAVVFGILQFGPDFDSGAGMMTDDDRPRRTPLDPHRLP